MNLADRILALAQKFVNRWDRPARVEAGKVAFRHRYCYACFNPIDGPALLDDGKPYCSALCVPAITRKAAGVWL